MTRGEAANEHQDVAISVFESVEDNSHLNWTKKRGAAHWACGMETDRSHQYTEVQSFVELPSCNNALRRNQDQEFQAPRRKMGTMQE